MAALRMLRPPASASLLLTWNAESDTDLRRIRAGILRFFAEQTAGPADGTTAEQMGLVATELTANALRHGLPPVVVRMLSDDDCYLLEVSDHAVRDLPSPADAGPGIRAGGRGLPICLAVAEQVGWYVTATTKHVWASFPRPRDDAPRS
ncbi:ATP-binding protein [Paractinoplanes hotanensis]|uniref:ATP-binding protein n=1 Tax=Paractinoplanes hotanensis TaxID=2906497 RepID=A0ABT0XWB1_9ACTN|nr:ATP-binding protein [Actinoplanes hotanensis]MCM4078076.1 ATP-binding protein [Actinoplanes hotanensis]